MQFAHQASTVTPPGVELGTIGIRPLAAASGVQEADVNVFTGARLMDGQDDTVYTDVFPTPLNASVAQALSETDWHELHAGNVGKNATVVLDPDRRPFTVGQPTKSLEITHFRVSSGHLNERLLRETTQQHVVILTGVLEPCG